MKRILSALLILFICSWLSGCTIIRKVETAFNELEADNKYIDELSAEIIRCFDEKDAEGIKALFCTNEKNNLKLDSQIENAFNLYEGKSRSFYVTNKSCEGGYKDGVYYKKFFTPKIKEIITDAGKTYYISYLVYTVYDYDIGKIGINAIGLSDWTENEIAEIG